MFLGLVSQLSVDELLTPELPDTFRSRSIHCLSHLCPGHTHAAAFRSGHWAGFTELQPQGTVWRGVLDVTRPKAQPCPSPRPSIPRTTGLTASLSFVLERTGPLPRVSVCLALETEAELVSARAASYLLIRFAIPPSFPPLNVRCGPRREHHCPDDPSRPLGRFRPSSLPGAPGDES